MQVDPGSGSRQRRSLAAIASVNLLGQVVRLLGTFGLLVFLSRTMEARQYASTVVLFSLVSVAALFSRLGLPRASIRLVSHDRQQHGADSACALTRRLGLLAVLVAAAWYPVCLLILPPLTGGFLHQPPLRGMAPIVAGCIVAEGLQITFAEMCRAHHRQTAAVFLGYAARATLLLFGCGISATALPPITVKDVAVLYVVSSAVTVAAGAAWLWRITRRAQRGPLQETLRFGAGPSVATVLGVSVPLMVNDISGIVLMQGDTLAAANTCGPADVAVYNAAARLSNLLTLPYFALSVALPPMIGELVAARRNDKLQSLLQLSSLGGAVPTVLGFLVLLVAPGTILALFFGSEFRRGSIALLILCIGPILNACTGLASQLLSMAGRHVALMSMSAVVAVVAFAAELLAGRALGIVGVAVASGAGTAVLSLAQAAYAKRQLGLNTWPSGAAISRHRQGRVDHTISTAGEG